MAGMNVNDLLSHELTYEIRIRGVAIPGTVDEKRKILRGLLSQEAHNRSFSEDSKEAISFSENRADVVNSLEKIEDLISKFLGQLNSIEHRRINSRLAHLSGRIHHMIPTTDEEISQKAELKMQLLLVESDLQEKLEAASSASRSENLPLSMAANAPSDTSPLQQVTSPAVSTPVQHQQVGPEAACDPLEPSNQDALPIIQSHSVNAVKKVPVYKWGIRKFSGKGSLVQFLELVESLISSRGCDKADLFASAGDLFEDIAWTWWRNGYVKGLFNDWDDLVCQLKLTFLREDYDENLLDEIRRRRQCSSELVASYICLMESQFNRLSNSSLSEKAKVNIVRRNLLPDYVKALALHDVQTFSELTSLCRKLENSFSPFSFRSSRSVNFSSLNIRSGVICWNCEQEGHTHNMCQSSRTIFCHRCGKKNSTSQNCSRCSNVSKNHSCPVPPLLSPGTSQDSNQVGTERGKRTKGVPVKSLGK